MKNRKSKNGLGQRYYAIQKGWLAGIMILLFFLLATSIPGVALAQVTEEWVARYNSPGNGGDMACALSIGANGNLYVTGSSSGDYATIKYDSNGNEIWVARYNGSGNGVDEASALAIGSNGNVYVTGISLGSGTWWDYATIKYDANGNQIWVARYNGPGNSSDSASAIAVDSGGNVYVTGYSIGSGSDRDYATIKYDANGNQLWATRYNGPGNIYDEASALSIDSSGNVYVTGKSFGSNTYGGSDYATIKYDANGNQLWVARYNGPGNSFDEAHALSIDANGNVYVTGFSYGSGSYADYTTIKYDANGNELWVTRYNGPGNNTDLARALSVDSNGNVYVTGFSWGNSGAFDDSDYATVKYDANGNQIWVARYDGPANDKDDAYALSVDVTGNVYVTGWSRDSGGYFDYATIKYDAYGNEIWVTRYNGPGNAGDEAYALSIDANGNVYVTGSSYGSGTYGDYATIKYSQTPPVSPVVIDIKPGSDPNSINLSSAGVVPVAILSTQDFNAPTRVNPDTITLAGAKVKMVGKSGKYLCHTEDVNSDTLDDLVCQVETVQFLIEPGDSTAVLEAETYDVTPIRGEDSIRIVP